MTDRTSPLPPNRTGGFPASGFLVSAPVAGHGSLGHGLRLRRLVRVERSRLSASVLGRAAFLSAFPGSSCAASDSLVRSGSPKSRTRLFAGHRRCASWSGAALVLLL